ncbi:unnamed protein product [Closterium sp. NIES-54]
MVQQVLQRFGFTYSSPQSTPLPTGHSLSAPPPDESVEPSGPYPELVGCLMYLMTCTRPDLAYPFSLLACYVAPGRHRKVHWDAAKRVLRYLCSTSGMGLVLGGRARVVLTGHADASWELRWLTFLLTDLGEVPRSPPVLRVRLGGYGRTDPLLNKPFYPNGLVVGILTWRVRLGGYGRTHPLLNKPFYFNGLVTGILTWCQKGLGFEYRCMHM